MMVVYLLCESHSGYDLPFMSHRLFPGLFGGPVAHEQHHQQGGGCRPPHTKHQTPLARQNAAPQQQPQQPQQLRLRRGVTASGLLHRQRQLPPVLPLGRPDPRPHPHRRAEPEAPRGAEYLSRFPRPSLTSRSPRRRWLPSVLRRTLRASSRLLQRLCVSSAPVGPERRSSSRSSSPLCMHACCNRAPWHA